MSFLRRHQIILASIFLCLLSLHMAFTNRKGMGADAIIEGFLSFVVPPVQGLIIHTYRGVTDIWHRYIYLVGVKEENRALKKMVFDLMEENNRLREEIKLNQRLKDILAFKKRIPFKTVAAEILGFNIRGWTRTLTINKGTEDGVSIDMPVLGPIGVVGRVIEVDDHTSRVLLITDPRSNVDVLIQRTRVKGVVEGKGKEGLVLKYIRQLDDVKIGDRVVTAGLSGLFPKGLLIGEVSRIEKGEDNFFKYIEVRPVMDIHRLEEVLIVKLPDRRAGSNPSTGDSTP